MAHSHSVKRSIIKKTISFGASTFVSRILGLARQVLQARYLGLTAAADAFVAAYKIPNMLRKIFAEGALTTAMVPTLVSVLKRDGKHAVSELMTLAFIVFEGSLFIFCLLVFWQAPLVLHIIAMGFSPEQFAFAVPFLRILIAFILCLSSSALLAGALQAVNHFFITAFAPVIINIFYLAGLVGGLYFGFSVTTLCFFILAGSIAAFIAHLAIYFWYQFSFGSVNWNAWKDFRNVANKFIPAMLGLSIVEISLFIDSMFASYLPKGSYALIDLSARFMQIPLGVFSVAFSSILLPHFARIGTYAPRRLGFYLLEATKFIFWVTVPAAIMMAIVSDKIFITLFVSDKFPLSRVPEGCYTMMAFLTGLFFFSINKVLVNLYYSRHNARVPTIASIVSTIVNVVVNFMLMPILGTPGLALGTVVGALVQMVMMMYALRQNLGISLYLGFFGAFLKRYVLQVTLLTTAFGLAYYAIGLLILAYASPSLAVFLLNKVGFWLWMLPLMGASAYLLYLSRKRFGVRMHFLD